MNPFDTLSTTNQNNDDKAKLNKPNQSKKGINKKKPAKAKKSRNTKSRSHSNRSNKNNDNAEIGQLKSQYSTVRLNMYDTVRLKLLQAITGKNSRSDLLNDMIKKVKPIYLNSSDNRKKYKSLFNYVIKGLKMKNKFNSLK